MVDVRVGIVSWNTAEVLDECLAALPAALGPLRAEIVVVDNASSDGSAAVAERHAGVDVIRNADNVGYARAMNQALAGTTAPVLLALNPDTVPAPGTLAELVAVLESEPAVGLVVPRLVNPDGSLQHSVYRFPSIAVALVVALVPRRLQRGSIGRRWWLEGASPHDRSGAIDWAIGAVHVIRAAALNGELPYAEQSFMYAEDIDLCWRLQRAGWTVRLDSGVDVVHVGNVAGERAWGLTRIARYWRATYDFVSRSRGRLYARLLALTNAVTVSFLLVVHRAGAALSRRSRDRRLAAYVELRSVLPTHVRAALRGPPPPDSGPARSV